MPMPKPVPKREPKYGPHNSVGDDFDQKFQGLEFKYSFTQEHNEKLTMYQLPLQDDEGIELEETLVNPSPEVGYGGMERYLRTLQRGDSVR